MDTYLYWMLYITGFILAYFLCKKIRNKVGFNGWDDVVFSFGISMFSYLGVIVIVILFLFESDSKPPKWM